MPRQQLLSTDAYPAVLLDSERQWQSVSHDPLSWAGRKVRLRAVEASDDRRLIGFDRNSAALRTSPEIGGHRHWALHRTAGTDPNNAEFAIETVHSRMLVGSMGVQSDPVSDLFSYSIGIGPLHRRCGYASDAVTVLLTNMFGQGFRTCEIAVHSGNLGSLTLHGVLGFHETARVPDTELSRGAVKYIVTMSMTAFEFALRDPTSAGSARPSLRGRHWRTRRGRHWGNSQRSLLF